MEIRVFIKSFKIVFLSKNHQSVNFFLLNLLLFQPKLNLQFGLWICRQNHFCASCLCRKKEISSEPVLLIGINRLIPFSRLTAAVSCWRICCHIEVLLNPEKDRKSELSFSSHCCIFQPALRSKHWSKSPFSMSFNAKKLKNEAKRACFGLIPKCWSTQ